MYILSLSIRFEKPVMIVGEITDVSASTICHSVATIVNSLLQNLAFRRFSMSSEVFLEWTDYSVSLKHMLRVSYQYCAKLYNLTLHGWLDEPSHTFANSCFLTEPPSGHITHYTHAAPSHGSIPHYDCATPPGVNWQHYTQDDNAGQKQLCTQQFVWPRWSKLKSDFHMKHQKIAECPYKEGHTSHKS